MAITAMLVGRGSLPLRVAALLLCASGCTQQMAKPPSYRPLQPSAFFADERSARPLVPGTVHREMQFASGKKPLDAVDLERARGVLAGLPANPLAAAVAAAAALAGPSDYIDAFPLELTLKVLERGRQRFDIFCAMC